MRKDVLKKCPHCHSNMRSDRLSSHINKVHSKPVFSQIAVSGTVYPPLSQAQALALPIDVLRRNPEVAKIAVPPGAGFENIKTHKVFFHIEYLEKKWLRTSGTVEPLPANYEGDIWRERGA